MEKSVKHLKRYSTNVRNNKLKTKALSILLNLLWPITPGTINQFLLKQFFTPHSPQPTEAQRTWLNKAKSFQIQVHGKTIQCWKWGEGPVILFVHGWNGIGLQFAYFFEPLLKAGYAAVTFDAPAHGASQGKVTNYFEYSDTIRILLKNSHCRNIHGIIAHSFGASAVINSLSKEQMNIETIAIAPALKLREIIFKAFDQHGIPGKIYLKMLSELENVYGYRFNRDNPHLLLNKLKSPIRIIHDQDDLLVPYNDSQEMAKRLPHVYLYTTKGLGHKRILSDKNVMNEIFRHFTAIKGQKREQRKM